MQVPEVPHEKVPEEAQRAGLAASHRIQQGQGVSRCFNLAYAIPAEMICPQISSRTGAAILRNSWFVQTWADPHSLAKQARKCFFFKI